MSAVIPFPAARRSLDGKSREHILRKARVAARVAGCNSEQRERVARAANQWLDLGVPPHEVIERAESVARALIEPTGAA